MGIMDPQAQFCHNPDCPARGQLGLGNIRVHSRTERRYRCTTCGSEFNPAQAEEIRRQEIERLKRSVS